MYARVLREISTKFIQTDNSQSNLFKKFFNKFFKAVQLGMRDLILFAEGKSQIDVPALLKLYQKITTKYKNFLDCFVNRHFLLR
jgi:hypothetical protein